MSSSPGDTPTSSNSDRLSAAVIIIIVLLCVIAQIVVAILIIRCVLKMRKQRSISSRTQVASGTTTSNASMSRDSKIEMAPIEQFLDNILQEKPMRFTPQNLIDFTQNYAEKLGSGGNGTVYKGQFPNGIQVAVKVLRETSSKKAEQQFAAEVGTISRTSHMNLVRLYGFCFEEAAKALVYEYMENGSLDKYLFDPERKIEWEKLYQIAVGTAKGIRYLHQECQHKIVHYDIKPANILLTKEFVPKIADFGLAKLCWDRNKKSTQPTAMGGGRGTPGYAAPEMWLPMPVTYKCDVYSYGMLLIEIVGRRRNYDAKQGESREWFPIWVWQKVEQGEMESIMSSAGIEEKDREGAEIMCRLAMRCIQYQPEARPSMNCVVRMLEGQEEIPAVGNPFQHLSDKDEMSSALGSSSVTTSTTYSSSRGTGGGESGMVSSSS